MRFLIAFILVRLNMLNVTTTFIRLKRDQKIISVVASLSSSIRANSMSLNARLMHAN